MSWSSSPDGNGRFRLPPLVGRIKTEPPSCDAPHRTTRSSEQHKDVDKETWPTEVDDDEEVMCLTEERPKRPSTSLYSRAPCSESPGCPYICRYCKTELPTSAALASHERKHIDSVCLLCDEKQPSEKALRLHVRTVCNKSNATNQEPENEVPDENFKCCTCLRIFRSSFALWRHSLFLSHNLPQGSDQPQGNKIPQELKKDLPKRPVGRPPGTVIRRYGRGRGMSGYGRGRGMSGYGRGRGMSGYGRGRGTSGYSRGRGKNIIFNKRRVWVYDKTPCDVCGRIFTSSCGMNIHRTHAHK